MAPVPDAGAPAVERGRWSKLWAGFVSKPAARAATLIQAAFGSEQAVRAELDRLDLLAADASEEERDFLWRAQGLSAAQFWSRYAVFASLYVLGSLCFAVWRDDELSSAIREGAVAVFGLYLVFLLVVWSRFVALVDRMSARLASPTEQTILALRRLAVAANPEREPIGLKRRRAQLQALRQLDVAAKRAGVDPLASRPIWMDVDEGADPRPSVLAFAYEFIRCENLAVERASSERRSQVWGRLWAAVVLLLPTTVLSQVVPKLVELVVSKIG